MKPGKQGEVSVFRRPAGNRIEPKLCGTMPSRALAIALVRQLEQAESVVNDLFLEATDDGIEALEAILRACRESVERRAARHHTPREPRRRRGPSAPQGAASPDQPAASEQGSDAPAGDEVARRGPRRRRSRPNRRGRPGPDKSDKG